MTESISLRKSSPSMGDLARLSERNRLFMGQYMAGPTVTPTGKDNSDFGLRFGTYEGHRRPWEKYWRKYGVFVGRDARRWAELSSYELSVIAQMGRFVLFRSRGL